MIPSRPLLVALAFAAIYLVWGSTYLAIRVAVETVPPFLMMALRCLLAGGGLLAWMRLRGAQRLSAASWREALVQGGCFFLGGHGLLAWAEESVDSGQAALILATIPVWMALGELLLGTARPSPGLLAGLALGIAGVAVLSHPAGSLGGDFVDPRGVAMLCLSGISWVVGSLRARRARLPGGSAQAAGTSLMAGGVLLGVAGLARGERLDPSAVHADALLAIAYLALFGSVLALTAYLWLLRRVRPTLVATHAFVNPVVAVLLGAWLADEELGARAWLATGLMVASVVSLLCARERRAAVQGPCPLARKTGASK